MYVHSNVANRDNHSKIHTPPVVHFPKLFTAGVWIQNGEAHSGLGLDTSIMDLSIIIFLSLQAILALANLQGHRQ